MLRLFARSGDPYHMTVHEAQRFDQRTFASMLARRWVAYRPGKGFHITPDGEDAWENFQHTSIKRSNPMLPLTSRFDLTAHGITIMPADRPSKSRVVYDVPRRLARTA
jgi:hypothetical protein